ncbi:hypothetical protein [Streptomyces sp. N35]|uniref:hypothetical protein n=1 Tax=Streptomyces sp. N35 TaxID=2795730 RepID=UPI0018F4D7EA|nr:hypothetical protein [Streptomyces sp. N35]
MKPDDPYRRAWRDFILAFLTLYLLIAVSLLLTGASAGRAWTAPLGLTAPGLGIAFVIYRRRPGP